MHWTVSTLLLPEFGLGGGGVDSLRTVRRVKIWL